MKNMIKVPWYIIISTIILTMFVTAKVFAHGEGKCITDVNGDVFLRDGSWVKIVRSLSDAELKAKNGDKYGHGHKNQYYDKHGNETTLSTEFFDKDEGVDKDEFYVDCSTISPRPVTPSSTTTPTPTTTSTTSTPDVPTPSRTSTPDVPTPSRTSTPDVPTPSRTSTSNQGTTKASASAASSSSGVSEEIPRTETRETIIYSPNTVPPPPPACLPEDELSHNFSLDAGWNLFHFSAYDPGSTVYELHNRLAHIISPKSFRLKYFNREIQDWLEFDSLQIPVGMDTHTGVMIYLEEAGDYSVHACTLENDDELILQKGWNVVGFPEPVEGLSVISDFFEHSVIREVKYEIDGETFTTGRNDDRVEIPIEPWQAYMVRVKPDFTFVLIPTSAAPMAPRRGTLATSWGGLKRIP